MIRRWKKLDDWYMNLEEHVQENIETVLLVAFFAAAPWSIGLIAWITSWWK